MSRTRKQLTLVSASVLFALFMPAAAFAQDGADGKNPLEVKIVSAAIKKNKLGDPAEQKILVYLPPSYEKGAGRYPVLYYLHGYGDGPAQVGRLLKPYRALLEQGKAKEMIIVALNGVNAFGGSFYVNSPVTGNWEDWVVREVPDYVDAHYRTLAAAASRGLMGYSMGGFGVLNAGLRRPDRFSSVCALCPGLFVPGALPGAMSDWNRMPPFNDAYGAAFAPNANKSRPFWDTPKLDGSAADAAIIVKWENGFGNLEGKVSAYLSGKTRLKGLMLAYGKYDSFKWITEGTKRFSEILKEKGVAHDLVALDWGHDFTDDFIAKNLFPFFFERLAF